MQEAGDLTAVKLQVLVVELLAQLEEEAVDGVGLDPGLGAAVEDDSNGSCVEGGGGKLREDVAVKVAEDLSSALLGRMHPPIRVHDDGDCLRIESLPGSGGDHRCHMLEELLILEVQLCKPVENVLNVLRKKTVRRQSLCDAGEVLHEQLVLIVNLGTCVDDERNTLRLEDKFHLTDDERHPFEQRFIANLRLGDGVHDCAH
mmetsp:Transcript_31578/g.101003  ORF Transcript_31578/g.101003 Transcript_31578/m.101003 type:complete len:202 (-) Transcript_31578:1826-2431(-)